MPEKSQTITVNGKDAATLFAMAYGSCEKLNWNIKYAGENILVAYTPRKRNRRDIEITVQTADNQLSFTSKMVHGEAFDMMGRNKKNIEDFAAAFENIKSSVNEPVLQLWIAKLLLLQQDTVKAAAEEMKQAAEVEKVMNFSSGNLYATYAIIALNVLVFVAMVATGINFFSPDPLDVLKWGGNLSAMTLSGDSWRLFTSMFLHFGILHLGLNMYALYMAGIYLEPMLGKPRYITAYICTGLLASLVSTIWLRDKFTIAAGASGAVFGMYGVFLALLTTNLIPKQMRGAMLQSTLIFVAYNVFYGFKPGSGIDNAAHLGGLISGMIIGYIYFWGIKNPEKLKPVAVPAVVALATAAVIYFGLNNYQANPVRVDYTSGQIFDARVSLFEQKFTEFGEIEMRATAPEEDSTLTGRQFAGRMENEAVPAWKEAKTLLEKTDVKTFSAAENKKYLILKEYVDLRIRITELKIKAAKENTDKYDEEISDQAQQINKLLEGMNE